LSTPTPLVRVAAALVLGTLTAPAWGQRIQFASPATDERAISTAASGTSTSLASAPAAAQFSGTIQPPTFDPYASSTVTSGYGTTALPQPQLGGPVQPYAPVAPQAQFGTIPDASWPDFGTTMQDSLKFVQVVNVDYAFLNSSGSEKLGVQDFDIYATFAFPSFLYNPSALLITPGFGFHIFKDDPFLPDNTYDAYVDASWAPTLGQGPHNLRADLGARVGVYSDFDQVNSGSIRYMARGAAVWNWTPELEVRAGVMYLDRLVIKLLPAGGVIWRPNPDAEYAILFPNPMLSHRLFTTSRSHWWGYVRGEWPAGGAWTYNRPTVGMTMGGPDEFDYSDIRVALGIERRSATAAQGLRFNAEIGYAFERKVIIRNLGLTQHPSSTLMFGAGIRW